jgi:hypothetical protein
MRAELDAVICSGALRGKQHTYALLDERAPNAKSLRRDEALAELAKRYFASHGPALAQDFAWWSGLTVADAKAGIDSVRQHLEHDVWDNRTYWFVPVRRIASLRDPTIHLLPNYDEFLIAYKDHNASLDAPSRTGSAALYDVLARHIIALNGKVIGGWRNVAEKNGVAVEATLFVSLDAAQKDALNAAAERYGTFIGMRVTLRSRRAKLRV